MCHRWEVRGQSQIVHGWPQWKENLHSFPRFIILSLVSFIFYLFLPQSIPCWSNISAWFFVVVVFKLLMGWWKNSSACYLTFQNLVPPCGILSTSFPFISNNTPHTHPLLLQVNHILYCVSLPPQPSSLLFFYSVYLFYFKLGCSQLLWRLYQLPGRLFLSSWAFVIYMISFW